MNSIATIVINNDNNDQWRKNLNFIIESTNKLLKVVNFIAKLVSV